jgi:hypothetical protein
MHSALGCSQSAGCSTTMRCIQAMNALNVVMAHRRHRVHSPLQLVAADKLFKTTGRQHGGSRDAHPVIHEFHSILCTGPLQPHPGPRTGPRSGSGTHGGPTRRARKSHSKPPVSLRGQLLWREFFYTASSLLPHPGAHTHAPLETRILRELPDLIAYRNRHHPAATAIALVPCAELSGARSALYAARCCVEVRQPCLHGLTAGVHAEVLLIGGRVRAWEGALLGLLLPVPAVAMPSLLLPVMVLLMPECARPWVQPRHVAWHDTRPGMYMRDSVHLAAPSAARQTATMAVSKQPCRC